MKRTFCRDNDICTYVGVHAKSETFGIKLSGYKEKQVRKWILQGEDKPFPEIFYINVKDKVDTVTWWKSMKTNKSIESNL